MFTLFTVLFIVFLFLPILIWWLRNIARVTMKIDVTWISDNLFKIFTISFLISAIFFVLMILSIKGVI